MLLPREQALLSEGYKAVLLQVSQLSGTRRTDSITNDLTLARSFAKENAEAIGKAFAEISVQGHAVDEAVAEAIRTMKVAQWIYLRHTKTAAIFIDKEVENAYAVKALTTPIHEVIDAPPSTFEAGVFQYFGNYVCDGLILNRVFLGPDYRAQFKAAYSDIRKAGRFHAKVAVQHARPT